jgi:uncharacterized repeat protein (TIGR04138 family)
MAQQQQQQQTPPQIDWRKVRQTAGPYPIEAFNFIREGLAFTAEQLHGDPQALPEADRHITGQQLCIGLRDLAIERYGMLAPVVLEHWQVRRTEDFGRIVFAMIQNGVMSKTDDDCMDDFRAVFDFNEAFSRGELVSRIAVG